MEPVRLNKFLAERLGVSRREADDLIFAGKVKINGEVAVLGARFNVGDEVVCDGKLVGRENEYFYIAFNKPVGYVCSRKAQGDAPTLYELLPPEFAKLKTVGRLDKDSSGLLLLTNDGTFTFEMTHPKFFKEKIYEVELDRELAPLHQQEICDYGVEIGDGVSKMQLARMSETSRKTWYVTIHEGRNRQIRRTFEALGYRVIKLNRIQFGKYQLTGLKPGKWEKVQKAN